MAENQAQDPVCRSVFKSGKNTTKSQFTEMWIEFINRSEKSRGFADGKSEKIGI